MSDDGLHFDDNVEADPLSCATFGLKGTDLNFYDVIPQGDPVDWGIIGSGNRPFRRVREGKSNFRAHGTPPWPISDGLLAEPCQNKNAAQ
jgi:hypothetical protein